MSASKEAAAEAPIVAPKATDASSKAPVNVLPASEASTEVESPPKVKAAESAAAEPAPVIAPCAAIKGVAVTRTE